MREMVGRQLTLFRPIRHGKYTEIDDTVVERKFQTK